MRKGGQCGRTTKSYEERCRHLPGQAEQPRYPEGQCYGRCLCQMARFLEYILISLFLKIKQNKKEHKHFLFL